MAEGQGQGQATPNEGQSDGAQVQSQDSNEGRTLTWEEHTRELQRVGKKEKGEGRKSRDNEFLQRASEYGVESLDDVFAVLEANHTISQEMDSAADKANKAREKAEAKATEAESRYTNTLRQYALRDALRDEGINPERIKGALRLADLDTLEVSDGEVTGLEEAVAAIKEEAPEWFAEAQPQVPPSIGAGSSPGAANNGANKDPATEHANWLLDAFTR